MNSTLCLCKARLHCDRMLMNGPTVHESRQMPIAIRGQALLGRCIGADSGPSCQLPPKSTYSSAICRFRTGRQGISSKETTRGELYRRSMLCIVFSDGSWLQLENEETTC